MIESSKSKGSSRIKSRKVGVVLDGVRARTRWVRFGAMRSDDEKDGSDPISTRRHFAERLDGTGKM